jgi:hypothetical protein
MKDSNRKLIPLLWTVIIVLVIGASVGGYMLLQHANNVDQKNVEVGGNNDSLRRQLDQAKAQLAATPTPTPTPTATPVPTITPKAVATPTPKR